MVEWHPTAENILVSAGYDHTIMVWNIARGVAVNTISCHTDTIYSMSFNRFEPNPYLFHATIEDQVGYKLGSCDPPKDSTQA